MPAPRDNLLLAYYGDDFTGSTDVMEALARAGWRTVLFLTPPSSEQLAKHPGLRAFGIAGGSRTLSPEEMERELPPAFAALKASGARVAHYKVCSTFDSSARMGSIGRAIELGRRVFGEQPTPLAVGLPRLGRYVVFGNLFARSGLDTEPCRLDRHPTMSHHPVTPMTESDIRLILGSQTNLPVELIDVLKLERAPQASGSLLSPTSISGPPPIVLFDTLSESHLFAIGREIHQLSDGAQLFVAGSSAVEYAWIEFMRSHEGDRAMPAGREPGSIPPGETPAVTSGRPAPVIVISGSCSPVTDRQIALAIEAGFAEFPLDPSRLLDSRAAEALDLAPSVAVLRSGRSLVMHSSRGVADKRFEKSLSATEREVLGRALGEVLDHLLKATGLKRAVVCGGDTSMAVARALGIEALEFAAPVGPGSPLCHVHAPGRSGDGCEMVFKGGQNGRDRFLLDVLETPLLRTRL